MAGDVVRDLRRSCGERVGLFTRGGGGHTVIPLEKQGGIFEKIESHFFQSLIDKFGFEFVDSTVLDVWEISGVELEISLHIRAREGKGQSSVLLTCVIPPEDGLSREKTHVRAI